MMRLDKFLAEAGTARRKAARELVKQGKVTVNEVVVLDPAQLIEEEKDRICANGAAVKHSGKVYYMLHKPQNCVTARCDEEHRTVMDCFPPEVAKGIFPIGRLDRDTEGLLLFTNDGDFNHALMHPDQHVDKTYFFWALGTMTKEKLCQIEQGLSIGENEPLTLPASMKVETMASLEELTDEINLDEVKKKYKHKNQMGFCAYLTIHEGRKHQVKRMLKAVGCYVVYLKRVAIGTVTMEESLKKGEYRKLTEEEVKTLYDPS